MSYIPLSDKDKKEMLTKIGISSIEDLFHSIPENIKLKRDLNLSGPLSELELIQYFEGEARKNKYTDFLSFLGAGVYRHVIPAVVDYLSNRGEFISPYTPYQPEVSQGTLQIIFEFQTLICQLTGMEVANASLYDGVSGAAEAVLMAYRIKKKPKILVAKTLHPQYKKAINTYTRRLNIKIEEINYLDSGEIDFNDLQKKLDDETSGVIFQSPNFFGVIEDIKKVSGIAHSFQALSVVSVAEAISLGMLEPPGNLGADIVTGEAQSFGVPLSFGGPYVGFMACGKEFIRQFPGRIAGQTKDVDGKRGFVLTLSTREQHIRRERATSNICTNQALCALRAAIFLETLGQEGLRELALQNLQKSNYALDNLDKIERITRKFKGAFFNEFVIEFDKSWSEVDQYLKKKGIVGGLDLKEYYPELENCALFCFTEMHKKEDIDRLSQTLKDVLR